MVLLRDKIEERIKSDWMIVDPETMSKEYQAFFDKEYEASDGRKKLSDLAENNFTNFSKQISFASYNIRIGKNIMVEAEIEYNLSHYSKVILKPFEVAIIQTYEIVNIPKDIIGRWNIKVSSAYDGLIWVGGPQVDPGYCGYLYCPVYNMSDKEIVLEFKKDIATMDFVQTTESNNENNIFNKKIKPFDYYKNKQLKSALTTHVQKKIDEMDEFKDKMEERLHKLQTTFLTVIGALFATLSILIISMKTKGTVKEATEVYGYITYFAIGISIASFINSSKDIYGGKKFIVSIIGAVFVVLSIIYMIKHIIIL